MSEQKQFEDGVYFNMSESDYHKIDRLSASSIKDILISIPTYWANQKNERKESKAQLIGRAYHSALLEPEKFYNEYCCELDKNDYPKALKSDVEVKAKLKELRQPQTKTGENILDRAKRLVSSGYQGEIFSILNDAHYSKNAGKVYIEKSEYDFIVEDIKRIHDNPSISSILNGGCSEVTILSTCEKTGLKIKGRIDKLKKDKIVDLKTFAISNGKPAYQFCIDAFMYNRYYLQLRFYQNLIADLNSKTVFHDIENETQSDLATKLKLGLRLPCTIFFKEKNGVPNILIREIVYEKIVEGLGEQAPLDMKINSEFMVKTALAEKADFEILEAKNLYKTALEIYGDGVWYNFDIFGQYDDYSFPPFFYK